MGYDTVKTDELKALSRLFAYPEQWPDGEDLKRLGTRPPGKGETEEGRDGLRILQSEYVSLFINALPEVPCPPYGSFYLEGVLMGASTVQVRDLYLSYGFQTDEMADHIAVELEFLALLAALPKSDAVQKDYDFLWRHLRSWTHPFLDRLEENDETGFYRAVSRYAREVLSPDRPPGRALDKGKLGLGSFHQGK
jgi:TorA maturation chaperone TorD